MRLNILSLGALVVIFKIEFFSVQCEKSTLFYSYFFSGNEVFIT